MFISICLDISAQFQISLHDTLPCISRTFLSTRCSRDGGRDPMVRWRRETGTAVSQWGPPPRGPLRGGGRCCGMRDRRVSHHICDSCICFEISRKRLRRPSRVPFSILSRDASLIMPTIVSRN